ncbi:hypothetical protein LX69_03549 [Breznakibacter xylanolyticus]|uniref:Uncharacterized protein n=1 Tax=Breznakibacter xylanolyticus TaxID=990 RepID=A0A2W7MQ51_9BACT|nr:hypothetical protein [Breznakibacter xylanolyticus]PZX09551.1 hypothetical protein LX69_03549 [Breznakibacter xylanolyticus]
MNIPTTPQIESALTVMVGNIKRLSESLKYYANTSNVSPQKVEERNAEIQHITEAYNTMENLFMATKVLMPAIEFFYESFDDPNVDGINLRIDFGRGNDLGKYSSHTIERN